MSKLEASSVCLDSIELLQYPVKPYTVNVQEGSAGWLILIRAVFYCVARPHDSVSNPDRADFPAWQAAQQNSA